MGNTHFRFRLLIHLFLYTVTAFEFHQNHDLQIDVERSLEFDHYNQHNGPTYFRGHKAAPGRCILPSSWHGRWFQSGLNLQAVGIDESSIATKGICLQNHDDKFLFYDKTLNCHKCLVINERHANVLQYKESPDCESEKESLESLCSSINGDAQLFSLFRIDAEPEECPFRGAAFNLTYNRGHGECKEPISRVQACTQPSRLLLKFEACPNVEKTESKAEELECLAHWREGSNQYLMGKLESQPGNLNNEEKYRCFIWEQIMGPSMSGETVSIGYRVAQSGDATCAGVQSATEGARVLTLMKLGNHPGPGKCKFPQWLTSHNWETLDGSISLRSHHHKNSTLHFIENSNHKHNGVHRSQSEYFDAQTRSRLASSLLAGSRLNCVNRLNFTPYHSRVLAQIVDACKIETICLNLFKRDSHVLEIGVVKADTSNCLSLAAVPVQNIEWLTLASASGTSYRCPNLGKYLASGVSADGRVVRDNCGESLGDFKGVAVGCGDRGRIEFHSKCATQEPITSYTCHGSWREGETGFLIASPTNRAAVAIRRICFVYTESEAGLHVSSSSESCRRNINPGIEGNWAFNLTAQGPCAEMLTSVGPTANVHVFLPILSVILVSNLFRNFR